MSHGSSHCFCELLLLLVDLHVFCQRGHTQPKLNVCVFYLQSSLALALHAESVKQKVNPDKKVNLFGNKTPVKGPKKKQRHDVDPQKGKQCLSRGDLQC